MNPKLFFLILLVLCVDSGCKKKTYDAGNSVRFPEIEGPIQITKEGKEHLFASYYGINSFGKNQRYVTVLETEIRDKIPDDETEYFNHTLFSRDGSKIFWLARAIPERNTTSLIINRDGTNLQAAFPPGWGGSHFDWLNGDELMITAEYDAKLYGHILFTAGQKKYKRLGNGLLDYDGHGTF
jgi:hypothetical protein